MQQYGCFVALNAQVQALVHVSELDVERVGDPASLFQAGDRIDVKVLDKNKRGQLQLSRQENCSQGSLLCSKIITSNNKKYSFMFYVLLYKYFDFFVNAKTVVKNAAGPIIYVLDGTLCLCSVCLSRR